MSTRRRTTLVGMMSLAVLVVGCGSDSSGSASEPVVLDSAGTIGDMSDDSGPGDDSATSAGATDGSVATGQGALPAGFPPELTPPDGAVYDELIDGLASGEDGGKKVFFVKAHVPGTVSEVTDTIRSQLGSAGFEITRDEDTRVEGKLDAYDLDAENERYTVYLMINDLDTVMSVDGSANVTYEVREK